MIGGYGSWSRVVNFMLELLMLIYNKIILLQSLRIFSSFGLTKPYKMSIVFFFEGYSGENGNKNKPSKRGINLKLWYALYVCNDKKQLPICFSHVM